MTQHLSCLKKGLATKGQLSDPIWYTVKKLAIVSIFQRKNDFDGNAIHEDFFEKIFGPRI